jgi:cytochrome c peroxidase
LSTYDSKFDGYAGGKNLIWMKLQVLIYSLEGKMCYLSFYSINKRDCPSSFMKSESEVLGVPNKYKN